MTSTICPICADTGMIPVEEHVFVRSVIYRKFLEDSDELLAYEQTVIDKTGGVDACPSCACIASAKWETR